MTKQRSAVVIAHPDDEILWLSAAMAGAQVVLCFGAIYGKPEKSAARARAVADLPLPDMVDFALPESGTHRQVDWAKPDLGPTGMVIQDAAGQARYDANFNAMVASLRPLLADMENVYTHNPWGEYGHPEHIQVHRAVALLQQEFGFTLWFSNYVAPLTLPLARQLGAAPLWAEKRVAAPNLKCARILRNVYVKHDVWTWSRLHRWPEQETYYAQPPGSQENWRSMQGETLLDVTAMRFWRRKKAPEVKI